MRKKQLRWLIVSYSFFTFPNLGLLIYQFVQEHLGFDECIARCMVPVTTPAAIYMLLRTLIFMIPTDFTWYVFYFIPQRYQINLLKLSSSAHDDVKLLKSRDTIIVRGF